MIPRTTLRHALADPLLLGNTLAGASWLPWRTLLIASMGEELTGAERVLFKQLTGREREPGKRVEEFVGVVGRRGGKSRAISVLATYIAALSEHPALVPGERGVLLIIAPDQKQADVVLDYIVANFEDSPILKQLIDRRAARELRLTNRIDIEVRASDFRRLRGPTYIGCIVDEVAFLLSDGAGSTNPDAEILTSVRPGMSTTNGMLVMISSPYSRKGELWQTFNRHFGTKGDPLIMVAKGASRDFNPTLPQSVVDRAMERDPARATAEYLGEFRRDIEDFIGIEAVRACIQPEVRERAPVRALRYWAFVDPSGGSNDSMTLAIAHKEGVTTILDLIREVKPPFSPEQVTEEYARIVRAYRCTSIFGDAYGGEWPREVFRRCGVNYQIADMTKSEYFQALLPLINSVGVDLLDNSRLQNQLVALERRTSRVGRDQITHPPGGHDDVANAVAGACVLAATKPTTWRRERQSNGVAAQISRVPDYDGMFGTGSSMPPERGTGWMRR
jgi:hypothetical protein